MRQQHSKHVLSTAQLKRGMLVRWRWGGHARTIAKESGVRAIGRVVTRKDYPDMACAIGIACLDDAHWVLDPQDLLERGRIIRIVESAKPNKPISTSIENLEKGQI